MSRTNKKRIYVGEKVRGKCCPGPECCLLLARPVNGASVSEWHRNHGLAVMEHS